MPNYCDRCGVKQNPGARFCHNCGHSFERPGGPNVNIHGDVGGDLNVAGRDIVQYYINAGQPVPDQVRRFVSGEIRQPGFSINSLESGRIAEITFHEFTAQTFEPIVRESIRLYEEWPLDRPYLMLWNLSAIHKAEEKLVQYRHISDQFNETVQARGIPMRIAYLLDSTREFKRHELGKTIRSTSHESYWFAVFLDRLEAIDWLRTFIQR